MENSEEIIERVYKLLAAHRDGLLGGEKMPEDENPGLEKSSKENYMYFTLPMSLNYQRNSYVLWECANRMYRDEDAANLRWKFKGNVSESVRRKMQTVTVFLIHRLYFSVKPVKSRKFRKINVSKRLTLSARNGIIIKPHIAGFFKSDGINVRLRPTVASLL